jgi:hypothetical protein
MSRSPEKTGDNAASRAAKRAEQAAQTAEKAAQTAARVVAEASASGGGKAQSKRKADDKGGARGSGTGKAGDTGKAGGKAGKAQVKQASSEAGNSEIKEASSDAVAKALPQPGTLTIAREGRPEQAYDVGILEEVVKYRKEKIIDGEEAVTFMKPISVLRSDQAADSYLKVRQVLESRVLFWMKEFRQVGFMGSQAFCAKERTGVNGTVELWLFVSACTLCLHTVAQTTQPNTSRVHTHAQEGNHRLHALWRLLKNPESEQCPLWLLKVGLAFKVPVNIYLEHMPDDLAMRYGRVMNELQAVAKTANFFDDARFIHNMAINLKKVA